jgi:chemotaxis protein CheY-P-specific phosphatase CheC
MAREEPMSLTMRDREMIDALIREGVGRTTARLEKMTSAKWGIVSSSIREVLPVQLLRSHYRATEDCVGAHLHSSSLVPLEFLITFSTTGAKDLAKAIIEPFRERMDGLSDPISLTVGEVSNFLAQSVLSVVADTFNVMIIPKPPEVLIGRKVELLTKVLDRYDGREDLIVASQVDIYSEKLAVDCGMVIIVNAEMMGKLLKTGRGT